MVQLLKYGAPRLAEMLEHCGRVGDGPCNYFANLLV